MNEDEDNDRLTALAEWRALFDAALAEARSVPDDGYSAGSARGRTEVLKALDLAEAEFWRAYSAARRG